MPKEIFGADHAFLPHAEILRYEEITRLARVLVGLGVRKVRVTGGEPLLRRDVEDLHRAARRDRRRRRPRPHDERVAARRAWRPSLAAAGLDRVTVSLDALDDRVFHAMNDVGFDVARVLAGHRGRGRGGARRPSRSTWS